MTHTRNVYIQNTLPGAFPKGQLFRPQEEDTRVVACSSPWKPGSWARDVRTAEDPQIDSFQTGPDRSRAVPGRPGRPQPTHVVHSVRPLHEELEELTERETEEHEVTDAPPGGGPLGRARPARGLLGAGGPPRRGEVLVGEGGGQAVHSETKCPGAARAVTTGHSPLHGALSLPLGGPGEGEDSRSRRAPREQPGAQVVGRGCPEGPALAVGLWNR